MAINDTSLDILNLPEEIVAISRAIQNASNDINDAQKLLKEKESYYKYLKSKRWKQYMTGEIPIEGVKSISAAVVTGVIESDEELYTIQKEIDDLQHQFNVHKSYLTALETKKRMIETSVKVALAGWYSNVRVRDWEEVSAYMDTNGEIIDPTEDRAKLRERRRRKALLEEDTLEEEDQEIS